MSDDPAFSPFGNDLFGEPIRNSKNGRLAEKFIIPPFSVLSAREGIWQARKQAWLDLGIKSECGRGEALLLASKHVTTEKCQYYRNKEQRLKLTKALGVYLPGHGQIIQNGSGGVTGTSIFDPVLCELCYTWFTTRGAQVLDPFAGGSVRGIVAVKLGRHYWGCDLSAPQVAENLAQARAICEDAKPVWVVGDALDVVEQSPAADFVFSCPPYGDLEVYSDDPRDLSTMEYHTFIAKYKRIILRCCKQLKPDRFAAFVVGDFRDEKGHYRNFVSDTIAAFREQGLELYNEAILVTQAGSLPVRASHHFASGRKLGKTHQNVLVFVKGSWKQAAAWANGKG